MVAVFPNERYLSIFLLEFEKKVCTALFQDGDSFSSYFKR